MNLAKFCSILDALLGRALVLLMLALVFSVTWQVSSRYLLQAPSSWTEELARFLLIWIGLLGAAYAYRTRAHMGIDVLAEKLGPTGRRTLGGIVALNVLVFAVAVMGVGGMKLVLLTGELEQVSAALGLPVAAVYLVIPISGLIIASYALQEIANTLRMTPECPS
jgi:TRAP-type C4-dicarboxylate transport system permease small subunit